MLVSFDEMPLNGLSEQLFSQVRFQLVNPLELGVTQGAGPQPYSRDWPGDDDRTRKEIMRILRCNRLFLSVLLLLAVPASSFAGVFISVAIAPPVLPVYQQPLCPAAGYIWTPGYWAYGPNGYFWVPGTWVLAPTVGYLWTPGYWGWGGGVYIWHPGYWGPHVGFYGGINYGYGYIGNGYQGGYWRGGAFYYNRTVNNVNVTNIHNTYNTTVVNNVTVNRVSYNGGTGGVTAQPTAAQQAVAREQHVAPTPMQTQHEQAASTNRAQLASVNYGQPAIAATPKPGVFHGTGVITAGHAPTPNNAATNVPHPSNANANVSLPNNANVAHPNNSNVPRPPENDSILHPNNGNANVPHPKNANVTHPNNVNVPHPAVESHPSHEVEPHGEPERHH